MANRNQIGSPDQFALFNSVCEAIDNARYLARSSTMRGKDSILLTLSLSHDAYNLILKAIDDSKNVVIGKVSDPKQPPKLNGATVYVDRRLHGVQFRVYER